MTRFTIFRATIFNLNVITFCPLYHTEIMNSLFSFSIVIFPGMASYKFVMNRCHVPFVRCVCLPSTCNISLSALTVLPYLSISSHITFSVNSTGASLNISFVKTLFSSCHSICLLKMSRPSTRIFSFNPSSFTVNCSFLGHPTGYSWIPETSSSFKTLTSSLYNSS